MQGIFGGLHRLGQVTGALHQAGRRQVFGHGLSFAPNLFVDHRQARARYQAFLQAQHLGPIFDGFFDIAPFEKQVSRLDVSLDGIRQAAHALGDLANLLKCDRVLRRSQGRPVINAQRVVVIFHLKQRQPQAGKRRRVIWKFFQRLAVIARSPVP